MIQQRGDLWAAEADARCVPTNGILRRDGRLVMGAGVARQAAMRYPGLDRRLGDLVRLFGNSPAFLPDIGIMSFPTKHDWREPADIGLIAESARKVAWLAGHHGLRRVVLPMVGAGFGGLAWDDVRAAIAPILDGRFTVVSK